MMLRLKTSLTLNGSEMLADAIGLASICLMIFGALMI